MTLITHIWNGNQTILGGDGRMMENGGIARDNIQKIFINKKEKFGVALAGQFQLLGKWSSYDHIYNLVATKTPDLSLDKFSIQIQKNFSKVDKRIKPYLF